MPLRHSLARLCLLSANEFCVRNPDGMVPTAKALVLAPKAGQVYRYLQFDELEGYKGLRVVA